MTNGLPAGMPYFLLRAVVAERIDAEDLAEGRAEVLRQLQRIAAAAAVGDAHVEQAEVRRCSGAASGLNASMAAVVVGERLAQPNQLARRAAVVGRRQPGFFAVHSSSTVSCVCVAAGAGVKSARRRHVASCRCRCRTCRSRGVPGLVELRMEREALEAALAARATARARPTSRR